MPSIMRSIWSAVGSFRFRLLKWCLPMASPQIFLPMSFLFLMSIRRVLSPAFAAVLAARQPPVPAPATMTSNFSKLYSPSYVGLISA